MRKLFILCTLVASFLVLATSNTAWSQSKKRSSVSNELNSLGTSEEILDRARSLNPMNKVVVVQKRAVDRRLRLEFLGSYGSNLSGDPYLDTQTLSGQIDFHINPYISLGGRYMSFDNDLNSEGKRVFDTAEKSSELENPVVPDLDQAKNAYMATLTFYPFYGKLSLFRSSIVQFDIYGLGGYGQIELESGTTGTYTYGGGLAAWISNRISARIELRNQGFQDQISSGSRDMNWTMFSAGLGVLL